MISGDTRSWTSTVKVSSTVRTGRVGTNSYTASAWMRTVGGSGKGDLPRTPDVVFPYPDRGSVVSSGGVGGSSGSCRLTLAEPFVDPRQGTWARTTGTSKTQPVGGDGPLPVPPVLRCGPGGGTGSQDEPTGTEKDS